MAWDKDFLRYDGRTGPELNFFSRCNTYFSKSPDNYNATTQEWQCWLGTSPDGQGDRKA